MVDPGVLRMLVRSKLVRDSETFVDYDVTRIVDRKKKLVGDIGTDNGY